MTKAAETKAPLTPRPQIGKVKRTAEERAKAAVNKFVADHLRNSDFAQDTPAWNHFQAGIPVLIGCIVSEMEE